MYTPHVSRFNGRPMLVPGNWVEGKNERLPKGLDYCRGTYLHTARTATPAQYQNLARRFAVQGYTVDVAPTILFSGWIEGSGNHEGA